MIRWFTKNHVAANVLMLVILAVGGFLALKKLGVEVEPSLKFSQVNIRGELKGGSPEDVEKQIVLPIEKALENLSGIANISSYSYTGKVHMEIDAADRADLEQLKTDIESRLQNITTFPNESEKPRVYIPDTAHWKDVISVAVYGDFPEEDLINAARKVRDDLSAVPGISKVKISNSKTREISIELIPEKLNAYGLTFDDVAQGIRRSSVDLPAGTIQNHGEKISIRSSNKAYYGDEFRKLSIKTNQGSEIRLEDVANVIDSFELATKEVRFNGENAILISVYRLDGENALDTANLVHDYIERSKSNLPVGIKVASWDDDSVSLRGRIKTLIVSLIQGAILVMIVLGLFLRPSVAFWVTLGIPISFAGACICMYLMGVTINNMSLFGFIIVLGIVVDDAIVTGENIYSVFRQGQLSAYESAVVGTQQVATPVTFGVITTIAAFVPLMFVDGYMGNMAKQIPLVVIPVLIFSLIESKFILPAHLKHLKKTPEKPNIIARIQRKISDGMHLFVDKFYQPFLKFALRYRYAVFVAFLVIFALTLSYKNNRLKTKHMPSVDRYFLQARLKMREGSDLDTTRDRVEHITACIKSLSGEFTDPETGKSLIGKIITNTGGHYKWGSDDETKGYVMVEITPPSLRSEPGPTNQEIVEAWRSKVGDVVGAQSFNIKGDKTEGKHREKNDGLEIQLRGSNEEAKLKVANIMQQWMQENPIFLYPNIDEQKGRRELRLKLKSIAKNSQLTEDNVSKQIRTAFYGTRLQKIQRGEDEINVMLRLPESIRTSLHTFDTLRLSIPKQSNNAEKQTAAFSQFVNLVEEETPPYIKREGGYRILDINSSVTDVNQLLAMVPEISAKMDEVTQIYPSVSWKYKGVVADKKAEDERMLILMVGLGLALFTLLAIPFKSFMQPLYVLIAVPFGYIGAVIGHGVMGIDFSTLSLFGILALAGVVVNDSLVMVDYINNKRLEGVALKDAVLAAGARRFRPIILTSITTFAGLMPLMFEGSIQAQFLIPMAVSLAFGIVFATAITLVMIPCIYLIGEEIKAHLVNYFRWYFKIKDEI